MTADPIFWSYSLAPDVSFEAQGARVLIRSHLDQHSAEQPDCLANLERLSQGPCHEHDLEGAAVPALLYQLSQWGYLTRSLNGKDGMLAACIPNHAPQNVPLQTDPETPIKLSSHAIASLSESVLTFEVPGAWARLALWDPHVSALLPDLAAGSTAQALAAKHPALGHLALCEVLKLMQLCGLFTQPDQALAPHEAWFHSHTRLGYRRAPIGKRAGPPDPETAPKARAGTIKLEKPNPKTLAQNDPPFATVSAQRQSLREPGRDALTKAQLSELLFRTLHARNGRRPYPSGGKVYPLEAYLNIGACADIAPGLYHYDPHDHSLSQVAPEDPRCQKLRQDAAAAAGITSTPQVLIHFAARTRDMQKSYGGLSYSLILKEVGAIYQTVMLASTAMGLASCPLGTGNAVNFRGIVGICENPIGTVGEIMVNTI